MKSKPRKTKPKSSKLSQVHRSQKALLRAFKHQTEELGHLRRCILELRAEAKFIDPGWAAFPADLRPQNYPPYGYSPTDSIDSPQP